jgi:subtilisin family serine protease
MTSFSSWGPVLDGRIKPDLVANGETLYSAEKTSDDSYSGKSGTSMAGPVAAGISALVVQE